MTARLSDHLAAARQKYYIGREAEKQLFRAAVNASELPFHLLYIYGPGGLGKTTLLHEFAQVCQQQEIPCFYLDGRNLEASPEVFQSALRQALALSPGEAFESYLESLPGHPVLLIDTYENLLGLDEWLNRAFFPQLPANLLVVLAGRDPLGPAWRADPGWNALIRVLPLRNLNPAESLEYAALRGIPPVERPQVLSFAHGHPLALSLIADLYHQRPDFHFQPAEAPDLIKTLLEQFVQKVPGPAHRAALEACALVRVTTEPLLAAMLGLPGEAAAGAHELFAWLRGLSFIEAGREGLFPHDLARAALTADLRWRNPDWFSELHRRARNYYTDHLHPNAGLDPQQVLWDFVYLHRENPVVRPFFEWRDASLLVDAFCPEDLQPLVQMVAKHEGEEAGRLAEFWLSRQPRQATVLREPAGQAAGFLMALALTPAAINDFSADPATRAAWNYLQRHAPLRAGECATHFRFWMARDAYQGISPAQSALGIQMVRHYLTTPGLTYSFFPVADPDFWAPLAAYANLVRLPETDYEVGGRKYGVYAHDWRHEPPAAWLALLGERELQLSPNPPPAPAPAESLLVLSEADFAEAVQTGLRSLARPDGLRGNPLARSRLVSDRVGMAASEAARLETLRRLLKEALETLKATPREAKFYRALHHTYVQPAPTQEAAAEALDLPFSTYRRHLKEGCARVQQILWQMEISGP